MAFFDVTVEKIGKVWKHPNADSLDLASLEGISFQFVMGKDSVKAGDLVVYFPIDSLLPETVKAVLPEVIVKKLSGPSHNRTKTVKLRQEVSQGLAIKLDEFPLHKFGIEPGVWQPKVITEEGMSIGFMEETITHLGALLPKKLASYLGVTKYEPPITDAGGYNLHRLPEVSPYYDIEGCERFQNILDMMMDEEVVITEKLEGRSSSTVCEHPEKTIRICQRSGEIVPLEGAVNVTHEAAKADGLPEKAKLIAEEYQISVTIRGELIGHSSAQGNYYRLPKPTIPVFEIWLNGQPIDYVRQKEITDKYNIKTVPVLFVGKLRDFLNGRTVQEASNGQSLLDPKLLREGIVIRLLREKAPVQGFGRIYLKQRSAQYLAKTEN